jgi:hypothetical protein
MKVVFRGWGREIHAHKHAVKQVTHSSKGFSEKKGPLVWNSGLKAYGKFEGLALSGAFLAEFEFDQAELKDWLMKFAESNPAEALRIIAEAQAEALISLSTQNQED